MRLHKTGERPDFRKRTVLGVLALVISSGLLAPAQAAAPTVKLSSASLADPTHAWQFYGSATAHTPGVAAWSGRPPEIVKLARSLGAGRYSQDQYAQRVFDYVRSNIETEFRFGLGKGARGAALDQSGTPFDQANLMVELLRQGNVSASYQLGPVVLNATEFGLWTGLVYNLNQTTQAFSVDAAAACTLLADGGIPATVNGASSCTSLSGPLTSVTFLHLWVTVTLNGTNYVYDPSYKRHKLKTGIDIPANMGCGPASAPTCGSAVNTAGLQSATQGSIGSAAFVQNVNRPAIQALLTTYGTNLQTSIRNTDEFAQLEDVAGGAIIDVNYAPAVGSTLPYVGTQPPPFTTWSGDIPDQYRTTLALQFLGIGSGSNPTPTFYMDELYGQRLRLATYGPPNTWTRTSNLYLEGRQLATAQFAAVQGTVDTVTLSINHPYAASTSGSATLDGTYADETIALFGGQDYRDANRSYPSGGGTINDGWPSTITIVCTLGRTGRGYQSLMSGLQATGEGEIALLQAQGDPIPEQHPALAAGMLQQQTQATQELEDLSKAKLSLHHTLGLVYAVYRDPAASALFNVTSMVSAANATSSATDRRAAFSTYALLAATLEGSVPQQGEDSAEADSAISLLSHANDDHEPLIAITNSADMTAVSSSLQNNGYTPTRISNISQIVASGYQIVVPQKALPPTISLPAPPWGGFPGALTLGQSGELVTAANEIGYDVFERQKGSGAISGLDPTMSVLQAVKLASYSLRGESTYSLDSAEGVVHLTPPPDIVVGTGPYPASLYFQRTYSSADPAQENCGWDSLANLNCQPVAEGGYRNVLGNGWQHNFQISAEWANNGLEAFAATSALRASGTLAALYAAFDLARSSGLSQSLAQVMVAYTMGASLMKNAFVIHLPGKTLTFVRLPDGTYDSPVNEPAAQITTNAQRNGPYCCATYDYSATTLQYRSAAGDVMNFLPTGAGPTFDIGNWTTADGVQVQFTYSDVGPFSHGYLASISNNLGHRLSFTIGTNSYIPAITAVTDENSRNVLYSTSSCAEDTYIQPNITHPNFSQSGLIFEDCRGTFSVRGVDGQTTSYSYVPDAGSPDPAGVLLPRLRLRKWFTPLTPNAPFLTVTYDQQMQLQTAVDALGNTTSAFTASVADEIDKLAEIQDPTGAIGRSYFDRYDNPLIQIDALGRVTSNFYDAAGRRSQTVYPEGDGISYQYDARSNVLSTTRFSKPGSGVPNIVGPITTYKEGPTVRVCSNLPTCNKAASVQDPNGNITRYGYSASTGQLLTETGPALTNGISGNPLRAYCYSSYGTTNLNGTASTPLSLLTGSIEQVTGSTTRVSTYGYNTANHYVLSSATVDPVASLTAASAGSPSCPGATNTAGLNLVTNFTFDATGNVATIADARGNSGAYTTRYSFDSMRRLTRVLAPPAPVFGASSPQAAITRYTYDVDGELTTVRHSIVASPSDADPTNPQPSLSAGDWQTESHLYWPTGDLQSVQDANGNVVHYAYDPAGHLNLVTDPDGRRTGTVYDPAGEISCIWKAWNSAGAPTACGWNPSSYTDGSQPLRYAAYAYTLNGRQRTVTDAQGNTTQLAYDGVDRLYFELFPDPDNGTLCTLPGVIVNGTTPTCSGRQTYEQYGYDNNDNRTSVRTRKGDVVTSTYNPINLLDTKTAPALATVNYTYYLTGDPMSVTQGGHNTGYDYDGAGRKHDESNDGRTVIYGYDTAGNRASVQWHDGYLVSYVYDPLSRLQDVYEGAPGASLLAHYDYDILSRRHGLTYGGNSGNTQSYSYEPNNSLSSLTHQMAGTSLSFGFGRNSSRQITSLTVSNDFYLPRPASATNTGYAGNALNEYTAVGPITGTDATGKPVIAGARGKIIAIPFDDLQIVFPMVGPGRSPVDSASDPGGNTLVHDLNGNLRRWTGADGGRNLYTYDAENRMRTAVTSLHNVSYDYDALGRRISKTVDGTQTGYLLDGDEEIAEYNLTGGTWPSTPARRYVTGSAIDDRIAMVDATNGNAKSYYHVNQEGSVLAVADSTGNVTQQLSYDEYGKLSADSSSTGQAFRYTGRRFDAETGLYYYRARYYAPQLGRFLQTDPVGYMDDLNLYAYVGNDPLNDTDPTGEDCVDPSTGPCETVTLSARQGLPEAPLGDVEKELVANSPIGPGELKGILTAGSLFVVIKNGFRAAEKDAVKAAAKRIPKKALDTLKKVKETGKAPVGHEGGRAFKNYEGRLPASGKYREYDVDPTVTGTPRNAERIVVDEGTGQAWYTDDHYGSFTEIK